MIIECPACATRYEVPDTAIGAGGRKVRCAKCGHGWRVGEEDGVSAGPAVGEGDGQSPFAEPVAAEPEEALDQGSADAVEVGSPEPVDLAEPDPADAPHPGEAEAAEQPARRRSVWLWAAVILAIMLAAAALAVNFWGLPDWVPGGNPTFAAAPAELVLDFPRDQQGRRQLPNGTEIFGASGTITNSGETTRRVPPILIVLRDSRERIVYSWEVAPPKRSLAPGESVAVNEAVTDAPRSAHFADIGWKPG